jgi:hypothetical protein
MIVHLSSKIVSWVSFTVFTVKVPVAGMHRDAGRLYVVVW